jgi:hypothetical protein
MKLRIPPELVRAAFVLGSVVATAWRVRASFDAAQYGWSDVHLSFYVAGVWLFVVVMYLSSSFRGLLYAIFATVLAALAVMMILFAYAGIYRIVGIVDTSAHAVSHGAADCLYFSIVTFTTLGYGDFYPEPATRLVAASEAIAGYFSFAAFIALLGYTWGQINRKNSN